MGVDINTEAEAMSTLGKLIEGYKNRHMNSVLSCYAPDPDLVYIGTSLCQAVSRLKVNHYP